MSRDTRKKSKLAKKVEPKHLEHINRWAAGIDISALYLIGEIGLDMTRWKNEKQFDS